MIDTNPGTLMSLVSTSSANGTFVTTSSVSMFEFSIVSTLTHKNKLNAESVDSRFNDSLFSLLSLKRGSQ